MGDYLDVVLDRHRQIWRERLWWAAWLAAGAGVIVGYIVRAWVG